jgi:hypothetical protein
MKFHPVTAETMFYGDKDREEENVTFCNCATVLKKAGTGLA